MQGRDLLSDLQATVSEPEQEQPRARLDSAVSVRRMFCSDRQGESFAGNLTAIELIWRRYKALLNSRKCLCLFVLKITIVLNYRHQLDERLFLRCPASACNIVFYMQYLRK